MQTINLNYCQKSVTPVLYAKQGDVGRKFKAIITDGTAGYTIPGDAALSVWYSGASGEGNYTTIGDRSAFVVEGDTVTVELITQMLNNKGAGCLCLCMERADGTLLGTWNIPYEVEAVPGMGSMTAEQHYNAWAGKKIRDISTGRLTDGEKAAFAKLDGQEWLESDLIKESNSLPGFVAWAYRHAWVDVYEYFRSVHQTFAKMFDTANKASNGYKYKMLPETEENKKLFAMLIPGSYGGGAAMTAHGYHYTLTLADFQVGDIGCCRYSKTLDNGETTDKCYYMALYVGDGRFLVYADYGAEVPEPGAVDYCSYDLVEQAIKENGRGNDSFIYYYLLRPENVAALDTRELQKKHTADMEAFDKKVAELSAKCRDINLGRLSRAEKAVLAGLKEGTPGKQVANLAVWAYAQANIDVSAYFTGDTISNIYRSLGNSNYYSVMLVPDSKNQQLDEDQLQIGDIFCGQYKGDVSTNGYWSAVYQGNNLWIKNEGGNGNAEVIAFDEGSTIYDAKEWNYYYILRPENIAVAEIDALKDLSKAEENYTGLLPIERGGTGAMTEAAARENLGITLANIGAMPGYLVNYDIRVTADSKTLDEQIDDILWEIFDKNRNNAAAVNAFVSVVCESGVGVDKFSLKAGGNRWMMLITKITSNYARVLAWCTGQFWMRTKHKVDPNDENWVWEDWEQEAPPMRYGVEYRTTEKWNGKPVYTKLVHCGYAPTDYKTVNHGIAGSFKAIRSFGSMGSYVLPAGMDITSGTKCNYHCVLTSRISITMANAGYTNLPVLVQIWYIKD